MLRRIIWYLMMCVWVHTFRSFFVSGGVRDGMWGVDGMWSEVLTNKPYPLYKEIECKLTVQVCANSHNYVLRRDVYHFVKKCVNYYILVNVNLEIKNSC